MEKLKNQSITIQIRELTSSNFTYEKELQAANKSTRGKTY